jgi:hypothetical protein
MMDSKQMEKIIFKKISSRIPTNIQPVKSSFERVLLFKRGYLRTEKTRSLKLTIEVIW